MTETYDVPSEQIELLESDRQHGFKDRPRQSQRREDDHETADAPSRFEQLRSLVLVVLTAPVIYAVTIPLVLLDLLLVVYQAICFSVYGIPKVKRSKYLIHDRRHLKYLSPIERLNCEYCAYANGLAGYFTEIAGRTEQYWCPIKHAQRVISPHSRYGRFVEFGDANAFRRYSNELRRDFVDVDVLTGRRRG